MIDDSERRNSNMPRRLSLVEIAPHSLPMRLVETTSVDIVALPLSTISCEVFRVVASLAMYLSVQPSSVARAAERSYAPWNLPNLTVFVGDC